MYQQAKPIAIPQQAHIPIGSIPINDAAGHRLAVILPQPKSGQTQALANAFERLPSIISAARNLDLIASNPNNPEISIANAWRDLRRAMAGIELDPHA